MRVQCCVRERQAHFIAFAHHQVAQRRRQAGRVFELATAWSHGARETPSSRSCPPPGKSAGSARRHRAGRNGGRSGRTPSSPPAGYRRRGVFAVISELDRRAAEMGFVGPGKRALGRATRTQADVAQGLHAGQVEIAMNKGRP